jgi:cytochrome c-type biogenesis protein CcmF
MADFGALCVLIALVVATYAGTASLVGARRSNVRLLESGRAAVYALAAVLGLASVAMVQAFLSNDYSIKYVQHYSDAQAPLAYKISAYWGGLDGSMLFWVSLLAVFAAIAVYTNRHRQREILPYAIAVMAAVADFFLYLIIFEKNPFDTFLVEIPTSGQGLNPLLQNPYMVTHPPALYAGFVGLTVPYAFAMAALVSGHLDDAWLAAIRRWALASWFMLTLGLVLGMIWAYEVLGWGGFWAWDPVENAGLLPWLTATAMLHSMKVQERRGLLRRWTFVLVILTFFLTIFGTFMTRSGIVQSVHAFGKDTRLAWIFTIFMGLVLLVSFGFLFARLSALRASRALESWLSREAATVVTNWLFVLAALVVMFATMFPTLSEAVSRERISVGAPFFNRWMVPIGVALLLLTGLCSILAWRRTALPELRRRLIAPVVAAIVTAGACAVGGLGASKGALLCLALSGFIAAAVVQEIGRGVAGRRRSASQGPVAALGALLFRVRRPYAGYLVHLGIALMFLGFAGQAFQREESVVLSVGQTRSFGKYGIRFDGFAQTEDRQKQMVTAELTVLLDGKPAGQLFPARWVYDKRPEEPATQVAILRGLAEDLYVTMGNHDLDGGTAALKLVSNPLVDWMWLGFLLMAAATTLVLLPDGRAVRAVSRIRFSFGSMTITLLGAAAALVYGVAAARLHFGAPLVVLGVAGLGLGLTALAWYRTIDPLLRQEATTSAERRAFIEEELQARLAAAPEATE